MRTSQVLTILTLLFYTTSGQTIYSLSSFLKKKILSERQKQKNIQYDAIQKNFPDELIPNNIFLPLVDKHFLHINTFIFSEQCFGTIIFENETNINENMLHSLIFDLSTSCVSAWLGDKRIREPPVLIDAKKLLMENRTPLNESNPRVTISCIKFEDDKNKGSVALGRHYPPYGNNKYPLIVFNSKIKFIISDETLQLLKEVKYNKYGRYDMIGAPNRFLQHNNFMQVLCHEIGHFLGFIHVDDENRMMYPFYINRYFTSQDYEKIDEIKKSIPNYFIRKMYEVEKQLSKFISFN